MKTKLKTGEIENRQSRANSVMNCVTTMSKDKKQLVKLISYMSTFDGCLHRRKNRHGNLNNANFILNMKQENYDYISWVQKTLECITSTRLINRKDYNTDGCIRQPQYRLESQAHPFLTKLHSRIYIDGKKVIDPHMLKLMDEEALAIIFMADGSVSKRGYARLNTKGFSYADNFLLSKYIYNSLGIRSNVNKHYKYFNLDIPVKDSGKLFKILYPHVFKSFYYKLERLAPHYEGDDIVWPPQEYGEGIRDNTPL